MQKGCNHHEPSQFQYPHSRNPAAGEAVQSAREFFVERLFCAVADICRRGSRRHNVCHCVVRVEPLRYSGAIVSLIPSSSGLHTIWHDSREFGSTASAMSSMSVSAGEGGASFAYQLAST